MHPTIFVLMGYAALIMLLVVVLHRFRPHWTRMRLIVVGALSGPTMIVIASVVALLALATGSPQSASAVDATYHAMGAYFFFIVVFAPVAALTGAIAAWLATRMVRPRPVA